MDLTKSAYVGFRLHEVVPVLIETGHIWATGVVMFAAPFWKALALPDREALAAAVAEGTAYFDELMLADEAASMAKAASEGGKVVPAEDRAGWQDGARKVWASFAPQLGGIDKIEAIAQSA